MSLYKKQNSRFWWYKFTFRSRLIQRSSKVTNRREAENIEKAAWTQLARGEVGIGDKPTPERRTIGELLDALESDFKLRGKDTVQNLNLIKRVRKDFESKYADVLTREELTRYLERRRKGKRPASNSTLNHYVQVLASAFKLADLPFPKIPKLSEKDGVRSWFFSDDEFRSVYAHLPKDLKDFCLFGYLTGWRKGAISRLTWGDVRNGAVYLVAKNSKNTRPYFVPLVGELAEVIERRRATTV